MTSLPTANDEDVYDLRLLRIDLEPCRVFGRQSRSLLGADQTHDDPVMLAVKPRLHERFFVLVPSPVGIFRHLDTVLYCHCREVAGERGHRFFYTVVGRSQLQPGKKQLQMPTKIVAESLNRIGSALCHAMPSDDRRRRILGRSGQGNRILSLRIPMPGGSNGAVMTTVSASRPTAMGAC